MYLKGRGMVHTYWLLGRKERRPKRRLPRIDAQSASETSSIVECHSNAVSESIGDVSPSGASDMQTRRSQSDELKSGHEDNQEEVNTTANFADTGQKPENKPTVAEDEREVV